jgi:glutamate racemase
VQEAQPIGIFDSGVGGLSVLRHVRARLPHERLLYVADQAHVPYGSRSAAEIRQLSLAITHFLLAREAKLIVVACNTASAAALTYLRETLPAVPFVGMEPAVKPAAAQTRSGKVGVLATPGTFGSPRYATLMARFARNVMVFEDPCTGLVAQIEAGYVDDPATEALLRGCLRPMLAAGVDTLVLGCTHYPFVQPLIERTAAQLVEDAGLETAVAIIDPAPAVARQTARVLAQRGLLAPVTQVGGVELLTSGDAARFAALSRSLLGEAFDVQTAVWRAGRLIAA